MHSRQQTTQIFLVATKAPNPKLAFIHHPSLCSENSTRFVWGTDDPEGFFTGYGWEGVQARQYGDPSIAAGWPLGDDEMRRAARPR